MRANLAVLFPIISVKSADLSGQDGIAQIEWPDNDAQDNLPPYQVGIADSEQPTGKPESTEKST